MTRTSAGQLARATALSATALALAVGVTACRGVQAPLAASSSPAGAISAGTSGGTSAGASSAPAPASADATSTVSPPATGSLSASVSSPVVVSGTVPASVTCQSGRIYRAETSGVTISGNQLSFTVAIAGYHGPGTYPAVVAVTLRQTSGLVTTLAGVSQVPAMITSTGGSFSVSATGGEGRTFTGSLNWVCGT